MNSEKKFIYRADIDGLRAIAVLLVVIFHAFPSFLTGGFIGVDVFFVISGYLITSILLNENGQILKKIGNFYIRRIRRIFPALIIILYCAFFLGWITLYATELAKLGLHIFGGAGFFANIIYENEAGYFDTQSSKKILLHLWSLSVEEQFYVIWPLLLAVGAHLKRHKLIIFLIVSASFLASAIFSNIYREFSYYSLITRFWQIGAGGMLAIYLKGNHSTTIFQSFKWLATPLLFLLIFFAAIIDREYVYPGFLSVIPVLITLILLRQPIESSLYFKIVSSRLMVYIGLISYPLYLWHWPIFAYMEYLDPQFVRTEHRLVALLCSFALSISTYELIEKNIRNLKSIIIVPILIFLLLIVGFIGFNAYERKGYEFREKNVIYKTSAPQVHVTEGCLKLHEGFEKITFCRIDTIERSVDVVLIGDSHAHQYFSALAAGYHQQGKNLLNIGWAGRKPFAYEDTADVSQHSREMSQMIKRYLNQESVKVFVLAYAQPQLWTLEFESLLRRTVQMMKSAGKVVVYIEDNPNIGYSPVDCIGFPPLRPPIRENCTLDYKKLPSEYFETKEKIRLVLQMENVTTYDYTQLLCPSGTCQLLSDGRLLFEQSGYISQETAKAMMMNFPYRHGF